eukprot:UN05418
MDRIRFFKGLDTPIHRQSWYEDYVDKETGHTLTKIMCTNRIHYFECLLALAFKYLKTKQTETS